MNDEAEAWVPPRWRVTLAFVTVPGLAAIAFATFQAAFDGLDNYPEQIWRTSLVIAIFTYPLGLLFGLPAYAILRNRVKPTWFNCTLAGACVAAAPWLIFYFLVPSADYVSINGRATVVNGARTAYGYLVTLQVVGVIALFGAFAGFLFWLIAAARRNVS